MRAHRLLVLLVLVWLSACAPSQRRLLAGRHYPEALAAVEQGAADGRAVLAAIAEDLELGVHVQAVPAAQLRAQLPGSAAGFDDLALVRVVHASHALSLPRYEVRVALVRDGVEVPAIDTSLASLAARSQETLPQPETIHHDATHDLRLVQTTRFPLAELMARLTVNVITVGLIHEAVPLVRDQGSPAYTEVREPSAEQYAAASPAAVALREWVAYEPCWESGLTCAQWQLWPREPGGAHALAVELSLASGASLRYRIPLPAGSLEAGLAQVFGARQRRLAELGAEVELEYTMVLDYDGTALTRAAHRRLCARVQGRRGQPGLRDQLGSSLTIESSATDVDVGFRAAALRAALIDCGYPEARVSVVAGEAYVWPNLRIQQSLE
jgi:hypothetical protein